MPSSSLWQRFEQYFLRYDDLGFSIDISRMKFPDDFFDKVHWKIDTAFVAMRELEAAPLPTRMNGTLFTKAAANRRLCKFQKSTRSTLVL